MEAERGARRRRRGVVIGVATVAGLGLVAKLLSFLRREKPAKKVEDGDIETLQAVLSGDAARSTLSPRAADVHVFGNLENDEPDHEATNGHDASPPFSERIKNGGGTEDGEEAVIGVRDEASPHPNGEEKHGSDEVAKHQVEDAAEVGGEVVATELHTEEKSNRAIEDAELLSDPDVAERYIGGEAKPDIAETTQSNGDASEALVEGVEELHIGDAVTLPSENDFHNNEDAAEALAENGGKLGVQDEGKHGVEGAVDLIPVKDAKHQSEDGGDLQAEDEGKLQL